MNTRVDESAASVSGSQVTQRSSMVNVGYDHDPAQIVNMALSLSEGRRRLASGRRYVSSEHGDRRVISTASTTGPRSPVKSRSIAPFLGSTRRSSRTGSPQQEFSTVSYAPGEQTQKAPTEPASAGPSGDSDVDLEFAEHISPATAARVEKAKEYFELAYEHRRLLPHLPPIRKPGSRPRYPGPEAFQKAYNPLQYVRNRKLRIWEKTPIDSEAEGWHDVPKVRAWVDAVASSHPETQHDPVECVRLPPFNQHDESPDKDESSPSPNDAKSSGPAARISDQFHARPIRPRSDWVTHPADLLADAYWLEQGMNKTKILDRDNNLIYPPNTQFKFSGWRNTTPVDVPITLQQPSAPPERENDIAQDPPPSALPELPTFTSAHQAHKHSRHGRRRDKLKDALQVKDSSSSREHSRLRRRLFQDSSESESSESSSAAEGIGERGRKRLRRKRLESSGAEGLQDQNNHILPNQSPQAFKLSQGDTSQGSSAPTSKRSSVDHTALNKLFGKDGLIKASPLTRSRDRYESPQRGSSKPVGRSSLENEALPRASTDYDTTTAPNSPNGVEWPSIAINLSPPPSRNASPSGKARSSVLHPFHRKHHKDRSQVSSTDFAHVPSNSTPQYQGSDVEKHSESANSHSRGTSPMTQGLRPSSTNPLQPTQTDRLTVQPSNEQWSNATSKVNTRSTGASDHSKVRGIFKGGRIAELVGNEVSRVGGFIWKRDAPSPYRHKGSASTTSLRSYKGSDSDRDLSQNGAVSKSPMTKIRSRSSTISSTKSERLSPVSTTKARPPANGQPRYNNPNLPSFTSPFQKDKEEQEKKQALLSAETEDHISRLAAEHRSASHSPRLDRIPLPKIDTGGAKAPTVPDGLSRAKSYGFGGALDLSRPRDASGLLNTAINMPPLRASRSAGDLATQMGSRGPETSALEPGGTESPSFGEVSWREISRAEALLYSSTVKAREIGRRAEDEDMELPKYIVDCLTPEDRAAHAESPFRIKKRERHIVAAQSIMKQLDRHSVTFSDKLNWFTSSMAPGLHTQLQTLEDMVENTMTPRVRLAADKAGELSMKLTTTSTLAVKELNDSIDAAFRRRRRGPIRLVRRIWFAGIEWTVVGLLWFIWAVVSLIQLVLGVTRGFVTVVKWLLWII
ncbi:hypothetical protein ABEF95_002987 [Exophiala dermatitidis]